MVAVGALRVFVVMILAASILAAPDEPQPPRRPRPQRAAQTRPAPLNTRVLADLEYARPGGEPVLLDLYLPRRAQEGGRPMPLIVWIHGGGWRAGDKARCPAVPLVQKGYAVASVNYRLSTQAKWPAQIHDCKAAIRWLRAQAARYGYDPDRIGVWGGSAGGHLVALLGTSGGVEELEGAEGVTAGSSRVQAVCDWFGPTDLIRVLEEKGRWSELRRDSNAVAILLGGPVDENQDKARQASPTTYVSRDDPPFLIVHGDKDPLVPLSQSELLHQALVRAGVPSKLHVVKGAGHGGPGFQASEVQEMILEFFDRTLRAPSPSSAASK